VTPVPRSVLMTPIQGARLRAMNEKREGGFAGSDSSSEEEEIEEELGYFSPLDHVNPYETFKNALTSSCRSRSFAANANPFHNSFPTQEPHSIPSRHNVVGRGAADLIDGGDEED
jgi:hypothetical protein